MTKLTSAALALIAALWGVGTARGETPRRVASANLCADQLLLDLADPGQIASLSPFARDPGMSFYADRARNFPVNRGNGEDLVRSEADLVLVGPFDSRYVRSLLEAGKVETLSIAPWTSFEHGKSEIRKLAARLGHSERGEAMIGRIDQALSRVDQLSAGRTLRPSSLVLHRRGFVFHAGISGEIAARAGLRDAAPDLGIKEAGFVTLERLVARPPDYLIVSEADFRAEDQGQALLIHPALVKLFPKERRLVLPDRLTICGGPSTIALAETLAAEIAAKVR